MIAVDEFESLLRFVSDPEDIALLLHWFPMKAPLPSARPSKRVGATLRTLEESGGESGHGRGAGGGMSAPKVTARFQGEQHTDVSGGKPGHGQGPHPAAVAPSAPEGTAAGGGGQDTPSAATERAGAARDATGAPAAFGRNSSIAMFKARPMTASKGGPLEMANSNSPALDRDDEEQDVEQPTARTEQEAAVLVAKAVKLTRILAPDASWGPSCKRRVRQQAHGRRSSLFVHEHVSVLSLHAHAPLHALRFRGPRRSVRAPCATLLARSLLCAHASVCTAVLARAACCTLRRSLSWRAAFSASGLSTKTRSRALQAAPAACHSRRRP